MRTESPLLLVASSARALAQSARKAGLAAVALDRFADRDTRAAALAWRRIPAARGALNAAALARAAEALCPPARCRGLVYGSGLEHRPEVLAALARERPLYGNPPEVVRRLKSPGALLALLAALGLPFPETRLHRPLRPQGWLAKQAGGAGGTHVRPAGEHGSDPRRTYFQRRAPGRSISLAFLADGRRSRVLGLSETWTTHRDPRMRYRYAGAVSDAVVPAAVRAGLCRAAAELTAAVGLRGLNGIDALVHGDRFVLLEVNPRPGATFELYDAKCADSLLALHLRACRGELPAAGAWSPIAHAHAVVYAPDNFAVGAGCAWPDWCRDVPVPGMRIAAGAPVCTVHAAGRDAREARRRVLARAARVTPALAARYAATPVRAAA